jgi:hypothetical protein
MMNKQTFFIALFLCMNNMLSATTFTVNNNNPSPGQYTTIAAAMSAAANGDIILINGSPTTYNIGVNITKSLTFIGTGYYPVKDNPLTSNVSFSGGIISAPNVSFKGIQFLSEVVVNSLNTTISECFIFNGRLRLDPSATGCIARNNVFYLSDVAAIYFNRGGINTLFENNIFSSGSRIYLEPSPIITGVTLRNNTFLANAPSDLVSSSTKPTNWVFQNNIFWNIAVALITTSSAFLNNISYSPEGNTSVPITNGGMNVGNINANPQFINYNGGVNAFAHNYRLQAASPGHLAGTDGTDIGAHGGATPRTDHGMPNIPVMKVMNITGGSVPVGGTIQVTFQSDIQN